MIDKVLLNLLENVLGSSVNTSRGNYSFKCPTCIKQDSKHKLEICLDTEGTTSKGDSSYQNYGCWRCGLKGKKIKTLFEKIKVQPHRMEELSLIDKNTRISPNYEKYKNFKPLTLPKEYIPLNVDFSKLSLIGKHSYNYLIKRNITPLDMRKYNMGYCETGTYNNRVILPSYDKEGDLNYFTARSILPDESRRYINPSISRDIIAFEYSINWDLPIIICEGMFDAISIKRNVIPILGSSINDKLMTQLLKSNVKKIYLALDQDMINKSYKQSEYLINEGKKVYMVDLHKKDPSSLGFINMLNILHKTKPLTTLDLLKIKMNL